MPFAYLFSRKKSAPSGFAALITTGIFSGIIPTIAILVMLSSGMEYYENLGEVFKVVCLILSPQFGLTLTSVEFSKRAVHKFNWNVASAEDKHLMCLRKASVCCSGKR